MSGSVFLLLIVVLFVTIVLGVFVWYKTHTDSLTVMEKEDADRGPGARRGKRRHFTEDDRQAVLLIRELADIMNTVDKKLK